jgi:hypothetical protein
MALIMMFDSFIGVNDFFDQGMTDHIFFIESNDPNPLGFFENQQRFFESGD